MENSTRTTPSPGEPPQGDTSALWQRAIVKEAVKASLIATFAGAVVFMLGMSAESMASLGKSWPDIPWLSLATGIASSALMIIPFYLIGLLIVSPLILVVVVIAAVFAENIQRHVTAWCVFLPLALWAVFGLLFGWSEVSEVDLASEALAAYADVLTSGMSLFFLFGVAVGSAAFYLLWRRRLRTGAP